ncbi:hypothetical protein [Arcobacter arenosus]|uniref:Uncharacterized protein n=1 Tax=Arcobacter arenosus TaxID=2576037 RepID=A0A5R8Y432_9BACT|nr:hypothetical protein [Arcobacter arenosus]TLP40728.1 hypothetical protein FDK22_01560 [Arcobacter arenosus]
MAKITLDIDDKNLPTVLNILENLKTGLIKNIDLNKKTNIKPVSSSINNNENKRYMSKDTYKQKLQQQKVLEDQFLARPTSSNKYLSKEEFKQKLKGK